MLSNHLILCCLLLLLPLIFPSIRGISSGSVLRLRWPKYWSFSFSISSSNEYSGLTSFRTGLISLQSKGFSRVFSSTTTWKHQFFGAQPSLWSNSHIHTWLLEKPSVQLSHSVMSDSLQPRGQHHTRLPCPSPSPRVCSDSCPLSQWCHPTILSCRPLLLLPSIFPSIRVSSNELAFHIRWPKDWNFSFSISLSNEHSGLTSFRID